MSDTGFGRVNNPLDKFTSYSTQFIMLACRSTDRARKFADAPSMETLDAINRVQFLGDPVVWGGSATDIYLAIDTRRFSQFTIERLRYEVLINGLQQGGEHGNLSNEITMTVLDSVGISFINYMQWLMDTKMQTNFDGLMFMLQVLFIGHHPDGSTETVSRVNIPMHLFKMDLNLDLAQGKYECTFMPNMNFAPNHHQRWLNIGTATNFTANQSKLGMMIDSFEKELNDASASFYKNMSAKLLKAGKLPIDGRPGEFGRMVQYQITIPEQWKEFTYTGGSIGAAVEKEFPKSKTAKSTKPDPNAGKSMTEGSLPAKDVKLAVQPGRTIVEVLEIMLKQTNETRAFANADKLTSKDKVITFYKFLVGITSDEKSFTVHVDVIPFEVPNVLPPPKQGAAAAAEEAQSRFYVTITDKQHGTYRRPKNYFELDYIFTGQNLDILSFDMKMQDLQFLLASNVNVGEGAIFNAVGEGQGEPKDDNGKPYPKPEIMSARQYDPIMMPLVSKDQDKNFSDYVTARQGAQNQKLIVDAQSYSRNLSAFYAQSPIMVNIVIKGNPDIMEKFNLGKPLDHTSPTSVGSTGTSTTNQTVKTAYREKLVKEILNTEEGVSVSEKGNFSIKAPLGNQSYVSTPVFVKLNIKGPNVDFRSNQMRDGESFATEVLYNNYYVVFKIVNTIERGVFTQELELWSHNVYGTGKLTAEQIKPTPEKR
jgi:hypothetical protein